MNLEYLDVRENEINFADLRLVEEFVNLKELRLRSENEGATAPRFASQEKGPAATQQITIVIIIQCAITVVSHGCTRLFRG